MADLTKDQVLHVANLARLNIDEVEIAKYGKQLGDILTEIDKIIAVTIDDQDILIAPTTNVNTYSEDRIETMLTKEDVLKNANQKTGDFISVPRVINE